MKRTDGLLDKPQEVACTLCKQVPVSGDSCGKSHIKLKGKKYERLKNDDDDTCGDCGVGAGKYHHDACDLETCPRCGEQAIGCGCLFTKKQLEQMKKNPGKILKEILAKAKEREKLDKKIDLRYPVIKWKKGKEYAVFLNNNETPLTNNLSVNKLLKRKTKFLRAFNTLQKAFDFQEFMHTREFGGIALIGNKKYEKDCKKYGVKK